MDRYKIEVLKQRSRQHITEEWERTYTRLIKVYKSIYSRWWDWEEHYFTLVIPPKRRIVTTRLVRIIGPKCVEYRIVDIYRDRLFKSIEEAPNDWRAEKLIFSKAFNRTVVKYRLSSLIPEQQRIHHVKSLYKKPRTSIEEILIEKVYE